MPQRNAAPTLISKSIVSQQLVEAMVDDILNASDEDILNEAHEDYGDAHKLTREVKRITASRSP